MKTDRIDRTGNLVSRAVRMFDHLERLLVALCALLLLVIGIVVMWQVVSRYLTGTSATWAPEVASITFVWLCMLGIAVGVRGHRHLRIDMIGRLTRSRAGAAVVNSLVGGVVVATFCFLAYYGFLGLEVVGTRSLPGTGFSFVWVASAVPTGATIAVIFALETLLQDLQQRQPEGHDIEEGSL